MPGNQYRTYREIEKSKLSAQQLRKILCVYALPEDERLLYENIFHCLSKKFQEPDLSSGFLTKLLNEKIELLSAVEGLNGKEREQLLLQLIAQNLYKFSIMEDAEIKTAIKKLERKNLRLLMKVIKYFYEEIPLAQTLIDQKKLEQNYKKLNAETSIGRRIEDIKNSKLDQQQKNIEYAKLRQIVELTVVGNATVILWDRWKQQLFNKTHSWFTAIKDRTTPAQETLNMFNQKQQKNFLRQAQVDYKKELNKYILIERGDQILKKYNEDLKEQIVYAIKGLKVNSPDILDQTMPGLTLLKFHWNEATKWRNLEEIYDELDDAENRWKKLKLKYHPDKNNNESAPEKFRQVIEAEEIYNKLMKNRFFLQKNEEVTKEHLKAQWEYERLGDGQRRMIDIYSEMLTILDKKFHKDPKCDEWVKERQIIIQCIEKGLPILNQKLPTSMLSFEIYRSEIAESLDRLMALAFVYTTALPLSKMIEAQKMSTNLGRVGFGTILQTVQQEIKAGLNNTKPKKEEIEPVLQKMFAGDYDPKIRTTFTELNHIAHNVNKSYEMEATTEDKRDKIRKKGIMLAAALQKKSEEQQKFVKNIALTEISSIIQK